MAMEKTRLESLDVLRGMNMFFITGGSAFLAVLGTLVTGSETNWLATQMKHVPWEGLHIYDLMFPLFLFITGVTFPFSMSKRLERGDSRSTLARHVLWRVLILVGIGCVLSRIQFCEWDKFRVWSVIGRIGIGWGVAALLALFLSVRANVVVFVSFLVGWWLFYKYVPAPGAPHGLDYLIEYRHRFSAWLDINYLTTAHRPEGGLETLAQVLSAMLGIWAGQFLRLTREGLTAVGKAGWMLLAAAVLLAAGLAWAAIPGGCPVVKNAWSSSYVLVSGGISLALLAVLYWIIDVRGWKRWAFYFRVIGMNGLAIYVGVHFIPFRAMAKYFLGALPDVCSRPGFTWTVILAGELAVEWLLLYFLYRRKIFIRV